MGVLVLLLLFVIFVIVCSSLSKKPDQKTQNTVRKTQSGYDIRKLPPDMPLDQQKHLKEIADFFGIECVTPSDIKKYTAHNIWEDFNAMPGWDIWDISVHETAGQYDRMERGVMDKAISVLCYDPEYQLAKVQGKTGIYLTSCNRCSCPDFRKRHLPCKHMYAVAIWLEGDIKKQLLDTEHKSLYGLNLALIGHLPRSRKGVGGIRADIEALGGTWTETIDFDTSAVVIGAKPSEARVNLAKSLDMECFTPEMLNAIFMSK